jgi:RHS repeat-associated protein
VADGVRQKFTGYERENETGLDYAKARYYGSAVGRFTTLDPLQLSGSIDQPQVWNRYLYGLNNPLKYTDPSGLAHVNKDGQFVGDKDREYNADLDAHWNAKGQRWDYVNQGAPVTVSWSESQLNSLILRQASERHQQLVENSLMQSRRLTLSRVLLIPHSRQPDIDQSGGNPFARLAWLNAYLRRHLNVGTVISGGTNRERGGRGRFQTGKDDLDQLDDVKHSQDNKPTGYRIRIDKSEQRVDNRLDRIQNLDDAMDEFGDVPIEENVPIDP